LNEPESISVIPVHFVAQWGERLLIELSARRGIAAAQTDVLDHLADLRRAASSRKSASLFPFVSQRIGVLTSRGLGNLQQV
jgi:hypothetical protein